MPFGGDVDSSPKGSPTSSGDAKKLSGLMDGYEPTPDGKSDSKNAVKGNSNSADVDEKTKSPEKAAGIGGLMGNYGSDSEESGSEDSDDGKLPTADLSDPAFKH